MKLLAWLSGFLMGVCVSGRAPDKRDDDWDRGDWEGCGIDTERSVAEAGRLALQLQGDIHGTAKEG